MQKVKTARRLVEIAAWCAVALLWVSALSAYVSPAHFAFAEILGLGFPFALAAVVAMEVVCLIFARHKAWIPLLGMLVAAGSIRAYFPINIPREAPDGALKVVTFNTLNWGNSAKDSQGRNLVARYIATSGADIVCVQEGGLKDYVRRNVLPVVKGAYPYYKRLPSTNNHILLFSRFPILDTQIISESGPAKANGSGVFLVKLPKGDTLRVVACHLESMHLTPDQRRGYASVVRRADESSAAGVGKSIIGRIMKSAAKRAVSADTTADYISRHRHEPLIVVGDFNDTPISYAYTTIGSGLTSAFASTGGGLGRSFGRDAIIVRIDHQFCSDHFKPYAAHIDRSITVSDHYPLVSWYAER